MWLEETFKDFQSTFGLDEARVGRAARLGRLVAALGLAVAWLHLLALPGTGAVPRGWAASVVPRGWAASLVPRGWAASLVPRGWAASLVSLTLAFLDDRLRPRPLKPLPLPKAA